MKIFLNDARQPLERCDACGDSMEEFVKSQEYARNNGFGDFAGRKYTGS